MQCLLFLFVIIVISIFPIHGSYGQVVSLQDVYVAFETAQSIRHRGDLVDTRGQLRIQQVHSQYQLQVSAQGQGDTDHDGKTGLNTGVTATLPLVLESQQSDFTNIAKTLAGIDVLYEKQQYLADYKTVTSLYFQALSAQESGRHVDASIAILNRQLAWLKTQVEIGKRKPNAVSSVQLSIQRFRLQKLFYARLKQDAMVKINGLTGVDVSSPLQVLNVSVPAPMSSDTLRHRTDLKKQAMVIQNLVFQLDALQWSFWPRVSAFGTISHDTSSSGVLGVAVHWTLLDGNKRELTRRQLQLQHELETLAYNRRFQQVVGESRAYFDTLRILDDEVRLAKSIVSIAETQYRQYQQEYTLNLITLFEVLETLNTWHQTRLELTQRQIGLQEAIAMTPIVVLGRSPIEFGTR